MDEVVGCLWSVSIRAYVSKVSQEFADGSRMKFSVFIISDLGIQEQLSAVISLDPYLEFGVIWIIGS